MIVPRLTKSHMEGPGSSLYGVVDVSNFARPLSLAAVDETLPQEGQQEKWGRPSPELLAMEIYDLHWRLTLQHRALRPLAAVSLPSTLEKALRSSGLTETKRKKRRVGRALSVPREETFFPLTPILLPPFGGYLTWGYQILSFRVSATRFSGGSNPGASILTFRSVLRRRTTWEWERLCKGC